MLQQAIEALRTGDRARARDLLTRLLKADQKNANYWVWLSAAVETQKERLYCLQTAIQLDPQNAAAKRGLILLGALPPDDSVPPFPVNRPRLWEEKLVMSHEAAGKAAWLGKSADTRVHRPGDCHHRAWPVRGRLYAAAEDCQTGHSPHPHPPSDGNRYTAPPPIRR